VTIHDHEETARFIDPVIYPNTTNRLGALNDQPNYIVLFFSQIQVIRSGIARIQRDLIEERDVVVNAAEKLGMRVIKRPLPLVVVCGTVENIAEQSLVASETTTTVLPHLAIGTIDA